MGWVEVWGGGGGLLLRRLAAVRELLVGYCLVSIVGKSKPPSSSSARWAGRVDPPHTHTPTGKSKNTK